MKRCPECRRDYYDDSLIYCLEDGVALVQGPVAVDEPATAVFGVRSSGGSSRQEDTTKMFSRETEPPGGATPNGPPKGGTQNGFDKRLLLVPLVLAVIVLGGFLGYRYVTQARQIESIAVMPFVNESGNADVEYLSDGMTETLISSLSRVPNLSVKPRSSVFRYKGTDTNVQTLGRELGVQAILNGRVVQRGDQLTLSLELVDVAKDVLIWSEQYNRRQSDLVSLQSEIARDVSNKLKTRLSGAEEQNVAKSYTANSAAYQLYLKGRYYWNKRTAENIRKAMEQFQQAADTDPNYALAYSGLADCYVVFGDYTGAPETETVPKVQAFAKRALALDGSLVEAQTALAYSYQQLWQWDDAEREFKRAIELDPNYATARHWHSLLLMETGRFDEGLREIKRAQELDPLSPIISYNVALSYLVAGDVNACIEQSKRVIDLDPNFPRAHQSLGQAYLKQNRYEEAMAEFQRAVDLSPNDRQSLRDLGYGYAVGQKRDTALAIVKELKAKYEKGEAYPQDIAAVYVGLGEMDQAFAWLEKSLETRTGRLGRIGYHMPFESLRADPRYPHLRRGMGLPE
jgi:TolB-like protein/Tfp pilus assembly protein PilF